MPVTLTTVQTPADLSQFVRFPWQVYRDDPNWVPPLISDRIAKLDPARQFILAHGGTAALDRLA